jgi:ring-1,2-phenylacetyl-CoA epoxidase subunit PaaC
MDHREDYFKYLLMLADASLMMGQRLGEWCGHGPVLEQDIALTNISLDCIGQARLLYQYAGEYEGKGRDEDDLAYLRDVRSYANPLLCEQPNGDFGDTLVRQYFFDYWQYLCYAELAKGSDARLAAIAEKSLKEIKYHLKFSAEWIKRLGLGTEESHRRMQKAVDQLWQYTGELFEPCSYEKRLIEAQAIPDLGAMAPEALKVMAQHLRECSLEVQPDTFMRKGGKEGMHSEHLGYILSDLQYMQRAYPGAKW